ncbi:MAG: transketolase C-terminal domain-containing protein [Bacteroidota bacterium]|nr:transketolase C-terminal domain-containing protein [Bacteroidota bacterium]
MRKELSASLLKLAHTHKSFVFLTGDLGFMAFEELESIMGDRFVNMGISEQNMISVAASLAYDEFVPFVYSIAPFVINRPFEQIRNELGLHNMPVKLIGNGGGYGYGIMGSTHHCLEDIALMRSVQNMRIYAPTYNDDIEDIIQLLLLDKNPNYLRLNNSVKRPSQVEPFTGFRNISKGKSGVVVGIGPVVLNIVELNEKYSLDLDIWVIGMVPFDTLPIELIESINHSAKVLTIEEHYAAGGIGELVASHILKNPTIKNTDLKFDSLCARGYPSGNYGDQKWHQEENSLGGKALENTLKQFFNK